MAKQSTSRLKLNAPLGRMPVLQFIPPAELTVDPSYQRSIDATDSQALIRSIAQHWNWDLCQPLVVSRRLTEEGERLFVIDGQHRLEASRLRGDIAQLPCVVVAYTSAADEAASFVHLNQRRRPLKALDLFKAALASEDTEALAIASALSDSGLSLAPHGNYASWAPGMVSNIGGIQSAWRKQGEAASRHAMRALSEAFEGQVLRYAGTIYPGIVAVCREEASDGKIEERRFERFVTMLALRSQDDWRSDVMLEQAQSSAGYAESAAAAIRGAWRRATSGNEQPASAGARAGTGAALPPFSGRQWCDQCDQQVQYGQACLCRDKHCTIRRAAA
ncbi:ParB N-terminal domain-containing protein [Novosphingobium sp. YJ-S2-02]|uniref:ParB N-terminal domain-containing protein n=1 Tax=Novosphingobium aureum TaxID=2792964 RepID=A0A931MKB8_9SPHN|nr:DUF6551 family protein [Novosphingobium aureum]MBH0112747.1 ParB N-terminal domain-containing protein [Novosphingobium aureum]